MRVRLVFVMVAIVVMALAPGCRCYYDPSTGVWLAVEDDPTEPGGEPYGYWAWDGPNVWMEGQGVWIPGTTMSYLTHNGPIYMEVYSTGFAGMVTGTAVFTFYDAGRFLDRGIGQVRIAPNGRTGTRSFKFDGMRDRDEEDWWATAAGDAAAGKLDLPESRQELSRIFRAR